MLSEQMKSFDLLFGIVLGELVLIHSDNLSKALQHKYLSAAEGQATAALSVKTIEKIKEMTNLLICFGLKFQPWLPNLM